MTLLNKIKLALMVSTDDFNDELIDLMYAAFIDMNIAAIDPDQTISSTTDPAIIRAVCCYCGYQFELLHGSLERSQAFKRSYDEMKAQMSMSTSYTVWTATT